MTPASPEAVSPLVRRLVAPNPGLLTGPGTNTWLVGTDDVAVIDPGPDDGGHLDAIAAAAGAGGRLRWILVTHTHPDHAPGAAGLAARTGAPTHGFAARHGFVPDVVVGDGWRLDAPAFTLRAVHTPGHASDHVCFVLEEEGLVFTGDHVLGGTTTVIAPPDGDMAAYLDSLRRLRALAPRRLAPGHGPVVADADALLGHYLEHRARREEAIAAVLAEGPVTVDGIVARVYVDVDPALHPVARHSVHAHLRKLAAEGRARGAGLDATWAPT